MIILLGTLDSNQYLVRRIEANTQEKVKKIYFNEKELNIKDEMSIDSLGLKDGSVLTVVTEEKEHWFKNDILIIIIYLTYFYYNYFLLSLFSYGLYS